MLVDYHVHAMGHADYTHSVASAREFLLTARQRGIAEVGFADHDYYAKDFDLQSLLAAGALVPEVRVRLGIEIDFQLSGAGEARRPESAFTLDFVIGSVHVVDGFVFDMPTSLPGYSNWDIDELYVRYYETLAMAAESRRFDIIGHTDVIKVFGFRPRGSALMYAERALRSIKASGVAVEINTNGRYKPVGEFYPAKDILERCFEMDIPITLSSDAHAPEDVGRDVAEAAQMAYAAGYRRVATFDNRKRILQPLDYQY
ncbi:MAG TPA: PHP domain-containing protein [Bacillota bacterium]|nr:PHP domain-containing protein [Bacillota bacterium]